MRRHVRSDSLFEEVERDFSSRILVLSVRSWSFIARGILPSSQAVVVSDRRIVAITQGAAKLGISVGDRIQAAVQKSSQLKVIDVDSEFESREFEKIVNVMEDFCPEVEVFAPGSCGFEMKGPTRYFGGEVSLLNKVVGALSDIDFDSGVHKSNWYPRLVTRPFSSSVLVGQKKDGNGSNFLGGSWFSIGVADGAFAAKVASGFGVSVKPGLTREFLSGFPVDIFGEGSDVDTLKGSGVTRVSDLAALPRHLVIERFGAFGKRIFDLGVGYDFGRIAKRESKKIDQLRVEFDPPAYLAETIVFTMRKGVSELFATLGREGLYPLRIRVVFETETAECISRIWSSSVPISSQFLLSWSRWQLDAWTQPGSGAKEPPRSGVIYCDIEVLDITASPATQLDLYALALHPEERVLRAIERARAKLGDGAIKVPRPGSGRSPKDQFKMISWQLELFDETGEKKTQLADSEPWPGRIPDPAPSLVFDPMVPVEIFGLHGVAVCVGGNGEFNTDPEVILARGVFDKPKKISRVLGPWPMTEKWWDPNRNRRLARVQVISEDGVAMIAVLEHSKWYLEAVYD